MKKLESTLPNMVIVLSAVAIITGGILAWVNGATAGPIAEQQEKTLADGIKAVMGAQTLTVTANDSVSQEIGGKPFSFVVHKVADAEGESLGAAVESTTGGFGGDLKVLVGFDPEGKVLGYTVLQHSETPGLGAKADKWFQKDGKGSIVGRQMEAGKPLTVSKDGGDVDAITASTITSRAFLKAVNQAYAVYAEGQVDATTSATDAHTGASSQVKHEEQ